MESRWDNFLMWLIIALMLGGLLTAGVSTIIGLLLLIIYGLVWYINSPPKSQAEFKQYMGSAKSLEPYDPDGIDEDEGSNSTLDDKSQAMLDELQESFDHELEEVKAMWCKGEIDSADISEALDELKDDIEKRSIEIDAKFGINRRPSDSET